MKKYNLEINDSNIVIPVIELEGKAGKTCLITAGIHGTEATSILAAMQLVKEIDETKLIGKLIIVPICNIQGFYKFAKQVVPEDQKNLNRMFPGKHDGTLAERLAYLIGHKLIGKADYYIDLHGADIHEKVMSFAYYPGIAEKEVTKISSNMAEALHVALRVRSTATTGAFNFAAIKGIPSILIERGGANIHEQVVVEEYISDIKRVLSFLKILSYDNDLEKKHKQKDISGAYYPKAEVSGFWYPTKKTEEVFEKGECLGVIRDFEGTIIQSIHAKEKGILLYQTISLGIFQGEDTVAYGRYE